MNVCDPPYNADPTGVVDSTAAIQAAVTDGAVTGATLVFPAGTYKITAAMTIPANVSIRPLPGALLNLDGTHTFRIQGAIEAGQWQIFSGDTRALRLCPVQPGVSLIYEVQDAWFGLTRDEVPINKAIVAVASDGSDTVSPPIRLRAGPYLLANPIVPANYVAVMGASDYSTALNSNTTCVAWSSQLLGFRLTDVTLGAYGADPAINGTNGASYCRLDRVSFYLPATAQMMVILGGAAGTIIKNQFERLKVIGACNPGSGNAAIKLGASDDPRQIGDYAENMISMCDIGMGDVGSYVVECHGMLTIFGGTMAAGVANGRVFHCTGGSINTIGVHMEYSPALGAFVVDRDSDDFPKGVIKLSDNPYKLDWLNGSTDGCALDQLIDSRDVRTINSSGVDNTPNLSCNLLNNPNFINFVAGTVDQWTISNPGGTTTISATALPAGYVTGSRVLSILNAAGTAAYIQQTIDLRGIPDFLDDGTFLVEVMLKAPASYGNKPGVTVTTEGGDLTMLQSIWEQTAASTWSRCRIMCRMKSGYRAAATTLTVKILLADPAGTCNAETWLVASPALRAISYLPNANDDELHVAAVPADGTHWTGRRAWASPPVSGQPMGWICTAGGSPGTWKAMGNLA